ncbi:MAG: TlpA family protein disulfide reductase [Sphingomonas sp.]|nr:TlpA family protein disulfide reductase [Sphingomonas sp.]
MALEPRLSRSLMMLLLTTTLVAGCDRQSPKPEQAAAPAANVAAPAEPKVDGLIDRSHKGEAAPATAFKGPDGETLTIADFKGKPVLVNLWATWCAPCIAEMPQLDALAVREAGKLQVLTVSQDLEGAAKVTPFFAKGGYKALKPYLDDQAALSTGYQANLPTTILYDSTGHEVWRYSGGQDWTGVAAAKLIAEAQ